MRTYSVHHTQPTPQATADYADGAVFVREGFAVFAFLFHFFWFLYHRMWLVFVLYLAVSVAASVAIDLIGLNPLSGLIAATAINLIVGFEANDLRRWTLARKGYDLIAVVRARSLIEAEEKYFSWVLAQANEGEIGSPAAPHNRPGVVSFAPLKPQAGEDDVVGLFPRPEGSA